MIKAALIPFSYLAGILMPKASKEIKEEIKIRKNWLKNWAYLLALSPMAFAINPDLCIISLSIANYAKASNDFLEKKKIKKMLAENALFFLAGLIIALL
ncbi:MAG: hypothetical protein PHT91_01490 [Candidatus Nanoarchaeia archaeon]|nr:hypothetical protein [Candidatus Nanoarchaeia archaeon]MDD5054092.1 hypothetical protein [Candidatus Nanoarchaeia archaeon]MDD5499530.1 hypothetical protein [Candidatus Nanoarchaeia archaeon]